MKKIEAGEKVFVDTNILLTATDSRREGHRNAIDLFRNATQKVFTLCLSGQVLREYMVVATRPVSANGLGLGIPEVAQNVEKFQSVTLFLPELMSVHQELLKIFRGNRVTGVKIHDLNILATMKVAGVRSLLTLNPRDFSWIEDLTIYSLEEISAF